MRLYIDLISGECSTEFPGRPGTVTQEVKALKGERLEIRWIKSGAAYEMPDATDIKMSVYDRPGGTKLAELTSLEAPEEVTTGFYTGRITFNTLAVQAMLDAAPTKDTFAATAAVMWKIPAVGEWEESDDIRLALRRAIGEADDTPVELVSPWTWAKETFPEAGGFTHDEETETISVTGGGEVAWADITGKPSTFTPSSHTHAFADITGKPTTLAGYGITDAAASSHTHAMSQVTGLETALGTLCVCTVDNDGLFLEFRLYGSGTLIGKCLLN
jgi:hypothetical protein